MSPLGEEISESRGWRKARGARPVLDRTRAGNDAFSGEEADCMRVCMHMPTSDDVKRWSDLQSAVESMRGVAHLAASRYCSGRHRLSGENHERLG